MNKMIGNIQNDLDILRLSVLRIAQAADVPEYEMPGHSFMGAKSTDERGWNRLCAIIINKIEGERK